VSDPGQEASGFGVVPAQDVIQRYGKYFLVRKLAEGGMAEIFLAKQVGAEGFERDVVIKRMLKHLSEVPDFVTMFLDEARLAARLAHQNIIQINDLGLAEGCYFICMEYLAGEDFSRVLRTASRKREYVPLHLTLRVIADAAHGLHYAHDFADGSGRPLNVVHRDISPSNLYVTYQGQVKVLDFGIAKAESRIHQTTAGTVKGKYMYMAPEQAKGRPVDRRADVFSLGVSLYEALTNTRPFARDNDLAILNAVLQGSFPPPRELRPDLPVEVEQVVLKAMAHKADQRYPSAGAMAAEIERILSASTSSSGGQQLAHYLRSLFGEARVTSKTRIPTLESLVASGMVVKGFTDPDLKTQQSGPKAPSVPAVATAPHRSTNWLSWAAVGVAGLALIAAGATFGFQWMKDAAEPPTVRVPTLAVAPPAAGPSVPPAAPVPQAAPSPSPPVTAEAVKPAQARPQKLTMKEIQRVVSQGRAPMTRCLETHKAELPATQGQVTVQVTIASSGKVTQAQVAGPLAGSTLAGCMTQEVERLKFPAHTDKEVILGIPYAYSVQQ
jgi:serine/threonine protein kinase